MEILRALAVLCESAEDQHERVWRSLDVSPPSAAQLTQLFVLSLPPYASIYLGEEGMLGGEARDRIAGFWVALGVTPPQEPDHLAALLGMYAALEEEASPQARHAARALLGEHVLSWLSPYLDKLAEIAPAPLRAWGALLADTLRARVEDLRDSGLPLALREAPVLADPREEGMERFISALLAPARSGILLVRDDLIRAAHTFDMGLRAGERRHALRAFFDQDPAATLRWLCDEAEGWLERHRRSDLFPPATCRYWASRAQRTMELLRTLGAAER